jgi:hypothetical protein
MIEERFIISFTTLSSGRTRAASTTSMAAGFS